MIAVRIAPTFEDWRTAARAQLAAGHAPATLHWLDTDDPQLTFFGTDGARPDARAPDAPGPRAARAARLPRVPPAFVAMARLAACARDPGRWDVLYRVLWRLTHGEPDLLDVTVDEDVWRLTRLLQAVRRDVHKMHAFVRFREVQAPSRRYVAWYEPDHLIVEMTASWFVRRFGDQPWSILTPDRCAHWDGQALAFSEGLPAAPVAGDDPVEARWLVYYQSIFNPARVNVRAMRAEMPMKRWKNLPEAAVIRESLAAAAPRVETMIAQGASRAGDARAFVPATGGLATLHEALPTCRGCELYRNGTSPVAGEGPLTAGLFVIGEQPGDAEETAGRPFVGPAGRILDKALADAGIPRADVYVTNGVKHFRHDVVAGEGAPPERGPRRIHKTPTFGQIAACRPWLAGEVERVKPTVLVCLGASALAAACGPHVAFASAQGQAVPSLFGVPAVVTRHPAAVLRVPDPERRDEVYADIVESLRRAAALLTPDA